MSMKILFVCTGNTCRSPMCSAIVNDQRTPFSALSAGLFASSEPISQNAADALRLAGILSTDENPYADHRSHTVSHEDMEWADVVVGVSDAHEAELKRRFPAFAGKIRSLPIGISDPYGGSLAVYENCLEEIHQAVTMLLQELDPLV